MLGAERMRLLSDRLSTEYIENISACFHVVDVERFARRMGGIRKWSEAMIKLGRVMKKTKGPILAGFAETVDRLTPGNRYPIT